MAKKWSGAHHKNTNKTDAEYCARCGKKLTGDHVANSLELNCVTGKYRNGSMPTFPDNESQGHFAFGSTCAVKTLQEQAN